MGLSCGMSMVKYGLFIFNFLCALAGISLITVGTIALVKLGDIEDAFKEGSPTAGPIATVVLGSIIFLISFFGCCGAIRESSCMVSVYAVCLFILLIGQIVLAVFAFIYIDDLVNTAVNGFNFIFENRDNPPSNQLAVFQIQQNLQCCGMVGPIDWVTTLNFPTSCCAEGATTCNVLTAFQTGCRTALTEVVKLSAHLIAWFSIGFGAVMLVGVVFACCLANSIRNGNRRTV